jgi:Xaa-Pro aminopeptidase
MGLSIKRNLLSLRRRDMAKDEWDEKLRPWNFFSNGFRHEYSARHTYGTDGVDFQERVNFPRMRDYRLGRLRRAMERYDLAALLLNLGDNIRYANGTWDYAWKGNNTSRYLLVFQNEDPYLFDTVGMDSHVTQLYCPWIKWERLGPAITYRYAAGGFDDLCKRYWDQIKQVCKENGLDVTKDKLGVDSLDIAAYDIGKEMGIRIVPCGKALNDARYIKSPDELECLKIACAWGDMAYWKAKYEFIKPGVREREVLGKVTDCLYQLGAQYAWGTNVASGGNTNPYIRAFTDKLIRAGDMVTLDLNSNHYYGYTQDTCRSWVVGRKMTKKQKEVYKRCYDLLQKTLSKIKAGATTADIASTWPEYYDDKHGTCSLVQFAHTIGQGLYEGFWVSRGFSLDYPEELQENMFMAVETWAGDPGGDFSVRLEDNLVVTKTGCEIFSLFEFEEEAVGFIEN